MRPSTTFTILFLAAVVISTSFASLSNTSHHQIQTKDFSAWSGTAWFINNQGYIATANHVVGDGKKFQVYYKHKLYPAYVVATDSIHDVAILRTNIKTNNFVLISNARNSGERVGIYGYPGGTLVLTLTAGTTTFGKFPEAMLYTHAKSCHGNSGGPIINSSGEAIGMLNWGYGVVDSLCSSEGGGPDIKYLTDLALKNGVKYTISTSLVPESFNNTYYQYKDSIMYIQGED